jgi:tyrosyl-tRNA synthetase
MGKTEKGAIWIDKDKISAYDFYQGIYQTPDACVKMMFALFTDVPMNEIDQIINENIVSAKKRLCYEITKFVRGEEDAILAQNMSENLFTDGGNDAPEFEVEASAIENGVSILDLLVQTNLCSSKGEARKMIANGGITAKGEKVTDPNLVITSADLDEEKSILLKKGKKTFIKVVVK